MRCDLCTKKCNKGEPCEVRDSASLYDAEDREMLRVTNEMNRLTRGQLNRLQEIIEFAKRMGYTKVGLAFCVSLSEEATVAAKILAPHFELHTVCCKTAGMLDDAGLLMFFGCRGDKENFVLWASPRSERGRVTSACFCKSLANDSGEKAYAL